MAGSINKVTLLGNLGRDPEIRAMQDGREVCNFTVATSETWKDKGTGERREKTEWHRVVIFGDVLVRIARDYLRKGSKVYLEGQLQSRKWTDKDGIEKTTCEIVLQGFNGTLVLLDKPAGERGGSDYGHQGGNASYDAPQRSRVAEADLDDEIPF